ncbi:CYTH domain-containing protein [Nocardia sp. CDC159]|uniref:CYTH domain-containing protein n=1 Tax=Nocardia pulmonis TaxID=2951408 RepID=A0A9X2E4N7_9NOCA|nr:MULTISPECIES: CYTH domain-containing protein [Nocardia]MCM6774164.1 CYTH domain-containing protein [Nocardia pulmonis]MCM6787051.1 CYTH domain-containing protein [Nocardia sp. CDC159]
MTGTGIGRVLASAIIALAVVIGAPGVPRSDAANARPDVEVKFDLVAAALDSSGGPNADLRATFGLGDGPRALAYEYFDTAALDLREAGWSVRLRHRDGSALDLNYKKRFPVADGDVDTALRRADEQGFGASDTNYDAQIDWTTDKLVLSFADKKSESVKGYRGTELPAEAVARSLLVDRIPGKLKNWSAPNWGRDTLAASRQHGPVHAKAWRGMWQGVDIDLEVVPVRASSGPGTETIIELSFKTDTLDAARPLRDKAIDTLRANAWLAPAAVLKTDLVLTRY